MAAEPSNCSITSSMLRSSRLSMTVATARRVPLNTQAPRKRPNLETAIYTRDCSSVKGYEPPSLARGNRVVRGILLGRRDGRVGFWLASV